jgi:hypothetical protein
MVQANSAVRRIPPIPHPPDCCQALASITFISKVTARVGDPYASPATVEETDINGPPLILLSSPRRHRATP